MGGQLAASSNQRARFALPRSGTSRTMVALPLVAFVAARSRAARARAPPPPPGAYLAHAAQGDWIPVPPEVARALWHLLDRPPGAARLPLAWQAIDVSSEPNLDPGAFVSSRDTIYIACRDRSRSNDWRAFQWPALRNKRKLRVNRSRRACA
jgi:hypothetical protein